MTSIEDMNRNKQILQRAMIAMELQCLLLVIKGINENFNYVYFVV